MKGKIYRIICNSHPEIQYVGSTLNALSKRWVQHKGYWKNWVEGKYKTTCSIYEYFSKYGIDDFQIILIKNYEVVDKQHLSSYEQLYINKIKCINKNNPWGVSTETCKWLHREYDRVNYQGKKELKNQYVKDYYKLNTDKVKARQAKRVVCACGVEYAYGSRSSHNKSKFHLKHLESVDDLTFL